MIDPLLKKATRRTFIKSVVLTGTASALAAVSEPGVSGDKNHGEKLQLQPAGYRLTPHIGAYYKTLHI